jgi:hypothetical protein
MRRVHVSQDGSKLNIPISIWFMLMVLIYCIGGSVYYVKKNTEAASKENGLEVNVDKTKYMVMVRVHNAVRG